MKFLALRWVQFACGRMSLFIVTFICLLFVLLSGCTDFGTEPRPMSIDADGTYVWLSNATKDTVYYFLVPTELVPLIDWIPCTRPSACTNRLPPQSRIPLGYANFWWVKSFRSYTSITVYWWKLLKNPDGTYRVDQMRSFAAEIP